jgi:hypothetical protein
MRSEGAMYGVARGCRRLPGSGVSRCAFIQFTFQAGLSLDAAVKGAKLRAIPAKSGPGSGSDHGGHEPGAAFDNAWFMTL